MYVICNTHKQYFVSMTLKIISLNNYIRGKEEEEDQVDVYSDSEV